jgi:hypothetical protein
MPGLALALRPEVARKEMKRRLPVLSGEGKLRLKAVRVARHKPGRRCVLEFDVEVDRPDTPRHLVTLIGKTRVRRSGNEGFRLQRAIWNAGFSQNSIDRISVPEPIGVIAAFQMWFQRKVPGVTADQLLATQNGIGLARRIAEALNKLHRAAVPATKTHTMADELRILRDCIKYVARLHPEWSTRLMSLMAACERLGAATPVPIPCGIHRDFYSAQVIVDGSRLWLLDFDLYCLGDPALDAGNFIAHITEQALRQYGHVDALNGVERALEDRFVQLSGEPIRSAVRAYHTLSLARHVYLSTRFPEREHLTEVVLQLCEKRLRIHPTPQ